MSKMAGPDDIAAFRRFNRMYTKFLGTLNEGMHDSDFTLAEARVLYEIATRQTPSAGEIVDELSMDPGYLSRMLGKFEKGALLKRKTLERDGRSAQLALTARGRSAFGKLNARSDQQAEDVFDRLSVAARRELLGSMRAIESILNPGERAPLPFILRPHRPGDMGWVVHTEGAGYAQQFGWDQTFEALVAKIVSDFIVNFDPVRERCWMAEIDGRSVGHVFLVKHPDDPHAAKLRLLFVEPCARGMGLGDALVAECLRFAGTAGYRKVVLWTQSMLTAAHRVYRKAGFRLIKEEPHHSFGHDLIGQEWERELPEASGVSRNS
jgi:DNA-binding MarR family transcriptional regulator/GNAT superfamily N-acetyltransferase